MCLHEVRPRSPHIQWNNANAQRAAPTKRRTGKWGRLWYQMVDVSHVAPSASPHEWGEREFVVGANTQDPINDALHTRHVASTPHSTLSELCGSKLDILFASMPFENVINWHNEYIIY